MDLFKLFTFRKVLATLILLLGTYELTAIAATLNQVSRLSTMDTPIDIDNNQLANNGSSITPFEIVVPDAAISDLKNRLQNTRLPDQISETTWEYGTDKAYLTELIDYWENEFDWREQERTLNQFDHFKTEIDGIEMHFIHQRSEHPDAIPLMIVHGWPGSISEFSKIIDPLVDPVTYGGSASDAFHVITPSLPGFGFSSTPTRPGYSPE